MFTSEGIFTVTIKAAKCAEPKFSKDPNAFDVCLQVETDDGQSDWWRGEYSGDYCRGNYSNMTRAQMTMQTLTKLGMVGNDLSKLDSLVGINTTATTKAAESAKGKIFYNVMYLGDSASDVKEITPEEMQRRAAALFGTTAPATGTPKQQQLPLNPVQPVGNQFGAPTPASKPAEANPFTTADDPDAIPFSFE